MVVIRYGPVLPALLGVYHTKCKHPADGEDLDAEDLDQFKKYREEIGDNIATIALMMQDKCQERLLQALAASCTGAGKSWQGAESALLLMQSSSETLNTSELNQTPKLFTECLSRLPQHPLVVKRALLAIGAHSEWLANESHFTSGLGRSGQPVVPSAVKVECLGIAIPFVMQGLQSAAFQTCAAKALEELCLDTGDVMQKWLEPVTACCIAVLSANTMAVKDQEAVIRALCYIINRLPPASASTVLQKVIGPVVGATNKLVGNPEGGAQLATALKLLKSACRILSSGYNSNVLEAAAAAGGAAPQHLVTALLRAIWPALTGVFTNWAASEDVTSKASDVLKDACKAGDTAMEPFMADLIGGQQGAQGLLVKSLSIGATPALLDLISDLLTLFGGGSKEAPKHPALLMQLVQMTSGEVFKKFAAAPAEHAALMEKFFELFRKFLRNSGDVLMSNPTLVDQVFHVAIQSLSFAERKSFKSAAMLCGRIIDECASKVSARSGK